jgi:hypothetical protein
MKEKVKLEEKDYNISRYQYLQLYKNQLTKTGNAYKDKHNDYPAFLEEEVNIFNYI